MERGSPYCEKGQPKPCSDKADIGGALHAGVLALIDRNFQGFGKELFTDAGKYVIHFGQAPQEAAEQVGRHFNVEKYCANLQLGSCRGSPGGPAWSWLSVA